MNISFVKLITPSLSKNAAGFEQFFNIIFFALLKFSGVPISKKKLFVIIPEIFFFN